MSKDARSDWDAFDPVMEIPAPAATSVNNLLSTHPAESVFFFAGDRSQQMRMSNDLPQQWDEESILQGADDAWRMARLSWLNSKLGFDRNTTSDGLKKMDSLVISTTDRLSKATMGG